MRLALLTDYAFAKRDDRIFTQRACGNQVDALADQFDRVLIIAPLSETSERDAFDYALESANVELVPLPYFGAWTGSLRATFRAVRVVAERKADWDVLYVRVPTPLAFLVVPLARRLGRPVCLNVVTDLMEAMRDYPMLIRPFTRLAGRLSEAYTVSMGSHALTITQGTALARRFMRSGGRVLSLIESPLRESDIRTREFRSLGSPIRLLYVGALLEKKGIGFLLEAVDRLRAEMVLELTLVGAGPWEARLRGDVARLRLQDMVRFVGWIDDDATLLRYYRQADIFVLPSLAEGVPRVLIEAMSQGLPVVSTSVGGITDLIQPGWNGVLVDSGSAQRLAEGIATVVHDETLRGRLTRNGVSAASQYTREGFAAKVRDVVEEYVASQTMHGTKRSTGRSVNSWSRDTSP